MPWPVHRQRDRHLLIFWDRDPPGFGVRVYPSGKKIFVVQTRAFGRSKPVSLGQHGDPQLLRRPRPKEGHRHHRVDQDRTAARSTRAGADPTVADLADRYEREYVAMHCKPLTISIIGRCFATLSCLPLASASSQAIEYEDILASHNSLHHMPTVANRAADVPFKMFNLADAWRWRLSGTNPGRGVPRFRVEKQERFLTREELFRLGEALRAATAERLASTHAAAAIASSC